MAQKILAFAGSLRTASFNKKLVRIAAEGARAAGAEVTELDLRDIPMPLYDGDIERDQGLPPNAKLFKRLLIEHQGMLISSPEYNTSITAVLKNAIDWASRAEPGETSYVAFKGKVGGLMSASPGYYGGVRSVAVVRALLSHLGTIVVPQQVSIPRANDAFDAEGNLRDAGLQETARAIGADVAVLLRKLA
ncbi:MAG TPA: NAD(P)H-dependent oxidoreductase [Burkholderiales bacterium]|nr:NAD(P)H-dependent oxidoreductase [Burkholderiales bacterium]